MIQKTNIGQEQEQAYCTFQSGEILCGIPVEDVREIVSHLSITPVPMANEMIAGLINLRGQVLTSVDTQRWLNREPSQLEEAPEYHLIVDAGDELMSLQVTEIGPVVAPQLHELEPVPEHLDPAVAGRLDSVARLEDSLILLLRTEKLKDIRQSRISPHPTVQDFRFQAASDGGVSNPLDQDIQ